MNTVTIVLLSIITVLVITGVAVSIAITQKKSTTSSSGSSAHKKDDGDHSGGDHSGGDHSGGDHSGDHKAVPEPLNSNSTTMAEQPDSSVQILNNTSKNPLHVFMGVTEMSERWTKIGGNGSIYPPVDWKAHGMAWDPIGANKTAEAIIPKGGSITLQIPSDAGTFRITPVDMKTDFTDPLPAGVNPASRASKQWPCLIEGGKNVVADASAVDGVNFAQYYQLTTEGGKQEYTTFVGNPCEGIGDRYQLDLGCRNPAKVDCNNAATCDCNSCTDPKGNQNCKFNSCSEKLFDIPSDLKKYEDQCDGGNDNGAPVKKFINKTAHIKDGTPLKKFAVSVNGTGDFQTYAYDYNDPGASPILRSPYKIRVTYADITSGDTVS